MSFPLETERLLIQPFQTADAEQMLAIWSDPEVMRWIPSGVVTTLETAREKVGRFMAHHAQHGYSLWPVREKASGRIIGDCGLLQLAWTGPEVEIAYRFGRDAWGKGYATEAAAACLRYGFEVIGLEQIIAVASPEHTASRRVMEKNGLQFVGTVTAYGHELVKYAINRPAGSPPATPASPPAPAAISPEQAAFLERQRSGRLATVDPQGRPHAVPICYALLDGILYTPIDEKPKTGDPRELRRIRNILANPNVCLVVDHYEDEDWTRLAWLQVRGQASLAEDPAERERALAALR
ncbi:MAG: GNAT family N-acetyltransferase, partial [Chloroflexota bacterium]